MAATNKDNALPPAITETSVKNKRALVLGGGGSTGNAWLIGVIAGLSDCGLDLTQADLIIGTSAGSTTAAQITAVLPAKLLADILADALDLGTKQPVADPVSTRLSPAINHMESTGAIIAAASDAADMRRRMGAWALSKATDPTAQTRWRATVATRLPIHSWPLQPMLITAVDADSGEPAVFDRNSGIELVDAVAASCAGGFAYGIGDKRYIDGGYRADLNADLAASYSKVLIIPPLGDRTRKPLQWGLHVDAQVAQLRALGSIVATVFPDIDSQNAINMGMNLMDLSLRRPSAQAGYKQGRGLAGQLKEFWG